MLCPGGSCQAECGNYPLQCPRARGHCPHRAWGEVVLSLKPTRAPQLLSADPLGCSSSSLGKGSHPPISPGWTSATRDWPLPLHPRVLQCCLGGMHSKTAFHLTPAGRGPGLVLAAGACDDPCTALTAALRCGARPSGRQPRAARMVGGSPGSLSGSPAWGSRAAAYRGTAQSSTSSTAAPRVGMTLSG